jgi:hypothetical protein
VPDFVCHILDTVHRADMYNLNIPKLKVNEDRRRLCILAIRYHFACLVVYTMTWLM